MVGDEATAVPSFSVPHVDNMIGPVNFAAAPSIDPMASDLPHAGDKLYVLLSGFFLFHYSVCRRDKLVNTITK